MSRAGLPRMTHGATKCGTQTKEYKAWAAMKTRCYNSNSINYKDYGGRGITVCQEWIDDFAKFLVDVGHAPEGKRIALERIDNRGNYEPGNVRWATPKEQQNNKRSTIWCEVRGERLTLRQISDKYGIDYTTLRGRYYAGGHRGDDLIRPLRKNQWD